MIGHHLKMDNDIVTDKIDESLSLKHESSSPGRRNTLEMSYGSLMGSVQSQHPTSEQLSEQEYSFGGSRRFLDSINQSFKHKLDGESVNFVKKYDSKYGRYRTVATGILLSPCTIPVALLTVMFLPCWMTNKMRILSLWLWVMAIATIPPSILFFGVFTRVYSVSVQTGDMVPAKVVETFNDISCKGVKLYTPSKIGLYVYHRLPKIRKNYTEPFTDVSERVMRSPPFTHMKKFHLLNGTTMELVLNATKYAASGQAYNASHVGIYVIKGQDNLKRWQRNPTNDTFVDVNDIVHRGEPKFIFKARTKQSDEYYVVIRPLNNSNVSRVDFGTVFYMNRTVFNLPEGRLPQYPNGVIGDIDIDFPDSDPRVIVILDGRHLADEETTVKFTCIPRYSVYLSVFVVFPSLMALLASLWICWACKDEPIQIMRGDSYEKV